MHLLPTPPTFQHCLLVGVHTDVAVYIYLYCLKEK